MSAYFDHSSISNSDIQKFLQQIGLKREMPANIQAIYDLGTEFHSGILEPHKRRPDILTKEQNELIDKMAKTFWEDKMCRDFAMAKDFIREKEFYEPLQVGGMEICARCKMDGARTGIKMQLELKGLNVTTEKQFFESLVSLDYDRAVAHYQLTSKYHWSLLVGISKKNPKLLFKKLVKRFDNFYAEGEHKLIEALHLLKDYSPSDVKLLAA